jgi:hypothetical protein
MSAVRTKPPSNIIIDASLAVVPSASKQRRPIQCGLGHYLSHEWLMEVSQSAHWIGSMDEFANIAVEVVDGWCTLDFLCFVGRR